MNPLDSLNYVDVKENNMEWIVKIETTEEEFKQRIKIIFDAMSEQIWLHGEVKLKNNEWRIFSAETQSMELSLEELQESMEKCVISMRKRLKTYENLDKGFTVLKWIALEDSTDESSQQV